MRTCGVVGDADAGGVLSFFSEMCNKMLLIRDFMVTIC